MVSACGEALVLGLLLLLLSLLLLLLLLLFPFHGHPHGCLSSLTALPSKTIIRDMQHLSLKIQRFGGKHATKTASAGAHRKAHSPQVSYTTFSVLSPEKSSFISMQIKEMWSPSQEFNISSLMETHHS